MIRIKLYRFLRHWPQKEPRLRTQRPLRHSVFSSIVLLRHWWHVVGTEATFTLRHFAFLVFFICFCFLVGVFSACSSDEEDEDDDQKDDDDQSESDGRSMNSAKDIWERDAILCFRMRNLACVVEIYS